MSLMNLMNERLENEAHDAIMNLFRDKHAVSELLEDDDSIEALQWLDENHNNVFSFADVDMEQLSELGLGQDHAALLQQLANDDETDAKIIKNVHLGILNAKIVQDLHDLA